jgi:hypothetical protein
MATTPKPPTAVALFKQRDRINQLEIKLRKENSKLRAMVQQSNYNGEILVVDGVVYKLSTQRYGYDPAVIIERVGLASDLAPLVCP